jgi:hypothetical protein
MNPKEIVGLAEAYMDVYSPERLDEEERPYPIGKVERAGNRKEKTIEDPNSTPEQKLKASGQLDTINKSYGARLRNRPQPVAPGRQKKTGVSAESFDLYDIILSHLLDEGYADTEESATAIMVNMSEDWKENIMERDAERGEDDPAVRAHNKSLKGKDGKPLYPSGRAGYSRKRPFDPRYGSPQR